MTPLKELSAEKKAQIKERENILRFETHCIFKGIEVTNQMREDVKTGCLEFYKAHEGEITVPTDYLLEIGLKSLIEASGVELNV